jgi:signal transduction histidine kinase
MEHFASERRARQLIYTELNRVRVRRSMPLALSRRITYRTILTVLGAGFGLVVLLLLAAAAVAVRNSRAIQQDTKDLVREQVLTSRLITETRAEQATLNAVFYQLTHDSESLDRAELVRQLDAADESLARLARSAEQSAESGFWKQLDSSTRAFTAEARRVIELEKMSDASLRSLFKLHEEVIRVIRELTDSSSVRARTAELKITSDAQELMRQSVSLLGVSLALALLCAVLTLRLATTLFRRMEDQANELNRVSWQMLKGQEEAARRFSHELHDELGQSLTAVKATLSTMTPDSLGEKRIDCLQLVNEAISNVRSCRNYSGL